MYSPSPPAGLPKQAKPLRCAARMCLFDRRHNRFIGNIAEVPTSVSGKTTHWSFSSQNACVVRCAQKQTPPGRPPTQAPEVGLYIELNMTFALTVADIDALPQNEPKVRRLPGHLPWGK